MVLLIGHETKAEGFENFQRRHADMLKTNNQGKSAWYQKMFVILTTHESYEAHVLISTRRVITSKHLKILPNTISESY